MLLDTELKRVFIFEDNGKEIELADPSLHLNADDVLNLYSGSYPILTTAVVEGPIIEDDCVKYKFLPTIGTKG